MNYIVALIGLMIIVIAFFLLFNPAASFEYLRKTAGSKSLYFFAIVVRLVMGILMYIIADQTRFPLTISILGIATFLSAVIIVFISRSSFEKTIVWFMDHFSKYIRIIAVGIMIIGAFLMYAVL